MIRDPYDGRRPVPAHANMEHGLRLILVDCQRCVHFHGRHTGLRAPVGEGDRSFFRRLGRYEGSNGADIVGPGHDVHAAQRAAGHVDHNERAVSPFEVHGAVHAVPFRHPFAGDRQDVGLRVPAVGNLGKLSVQRLDARFEMH